MADIFISYASEDRDRVKPLAQALEEQGWSVFWDRTIPGGKIWDEVIEEALDAAKCVIVIWSKISKSSKWVRAEAEEGLKRNILVPVSIETIKIPLLFRPIQAVSLINWQEDSSHPQFKKLLSDLSSILGPSPLKLKEEKDKRAEEERRRQQEKERKLREDEEKRIEATRLAGEERRHREADVKRKAKAVQKRKELKTKAKLTQPEAAEIKPPEEYPFFVLYTFNELKILSIDSPLILFTDKAERGLGEKNALKAFKKKVFPIISPIAENSNTKIAWANVGGIINMYDIAKFLKDKGLRFSGVFLIKNGEVVKFEKMPFLSLDEDYVRAAKKIFASL